MKTVLFITYHEPTVHMCVNIASVLDPRKYKIVFIAYEESAKQSLEKRNIQYYDKRKKIIEVIKEVKPSIIITPHNLNPIGYLFVKNAHYLNIPTLLMLEGGSEQSQFLEEKTTTNTKTQLTPLSLHDIFYLSFFKIKKSRYGSQHMAHLGSDKIAVMSAKSESFIRDILKIDTPIEVTGQPRFDDAVNKLYHQSEMKNQYNLDSRRIILVLTSIVVVDGIWKSSKLTSFILNMIRITEETNSQLIVKIHPRESLDYYKKINDNLKVTKNHLYELINLADVIVSIPSTTTLEALMFKKPVIIPDFLTKKSYAEELGLKTGAKSYDDIKEMIKKPLKTTNDIEQFVYKIDGKASERVAKLIGGMI